MRSLSKLSIAISLSAAMLAIASCTGSNATLTLPSEKTGASESQSNAGLARPSRIVTSGMQVHSTDSAHVYVGVYLRGQSGGVWGYDGNPAGGPLCKVSLKTSAVARAIPVPEGMATDEQGNLYVTTENWSGGPSDIRTYDPQCGSQTRRIINPYGVGPHYIALHGTTWYVANQYGYGLPAGNVAVCSASGCSRELTNPSNYNDFEPNGVAVDANGNVYASATSYADPPKNLLAEWPHGKMPGKLVSGYDQGASYVAGPLQFDKDGNLLSTERPNDLFVYSGCPSACTAHGPFQLQNNDGDAYQDFKLNKQNSELFVADGTWGQIDVYSYHGTSGVTYLYSIAKDLGFSNIGVSGVALDPTATP